MSLDRTKLLESHASAGVGVADTTHTTSIRMPGGRMTSRFNRTVLGTVVAMTLAACGGTVAPTGDLASVDQTPPPSFTTSPTPSATLASTAPSAGGIPSPDASTLARNGVIVYSDTAGDIHSLDPETGKTTLLIGGPTNDFGPGFLPDQTRFQFVRLEGDEDVFYSANADGSDVQRVGPAKEMANSEYSPQGDRLASVQEGGSNPTITDVASGSKRVIPLTKPVNIVSWLTDDLLFVADLHDEGSAVEMWTVNADGTGQEVIPAPGLCCGVSTLRGRGLVAWDSWASGAEGRVHIYDTATGIDRLLASTDVPGAHFLDALWSPDGKWLTARRVMAGVDGVQLVLLASDGSGEAIALGPKLPTNQGEIRSTFSPDGTKLLVTYEDGSAWLFDLPAGTGGKTDWSGVVEATWQGLPPTP